MSDGRPMLRVVRDDDEEPAGCHSCPLLARERARTARLANAVRIGLSIVVRALRQLDA